MGGGQHELLSVAESMLPPVDAGLERDAAVLRMLRQSRLVPRIPKVELTEYDMEGWRKLLDDPRWYAMSCRVINSFEKWLYPDEERHSVATVWHVWDEYLRQVRYARAWTADRDDDES
jgi:hypothetical protein